ncbi:helix-turn-helix domain-containing protein [Streptomyces chartreusis]|uniref:helix-turn-helix domain-containing protein n=1 Tax=Streptomyces chartreusis TaxID=1969 RepID=UPI003635FD93
MTHRNATLTVEGRRRLVERCRTRPIAHVAAEMGVSRACASKWVNRYRSHGELGLEDRSSTPHHQPTATPSEVLALVEELRRTHKWSAARIAFELAQAGPPISRRTVNRHLAEIGINRRRFIDPSGESNRQPRKIHARWPGHMIHVDVKKVGRIPDLGGWRAHGRGSDQAKAVNRRKKKVERYNRILAEEFLYARTWTSEAQRTRLPGRWIIHYNYHRPHTVLGNQPPAARLPSGVTNVLASYT